MDSFASLVELLVSIQEEKRSQPCACIDLDLAIVKSSSEVLLFRAFRTAEDIH